MDDYAGVASALFADAGIGDLPPIVRPELLRQGRLVEVMPYWNFHPSGLTPLHLGHLGRPAAVYRRRLP